MSGLAIDVQGVSKRYRIGPTAPYERFSELLMRGVRAPLRGVRRGVAAGNPSIGHIWSLRDVSFSVAPGEVVGLIGRNGAGKSTLLKVLARITEPTSGRALVRGRVGSLLEVGTGFHPELTGRENVYLNGAVLGMSRREIARKFDEIVAFSEVEEFLDTPVKRYSSGMTVRLAFGVAAHLDPEILLVDEVLAVGDAGFQKKCLGRMQSAVTGGRTVLFVSHNLGAVSELCQRAVLLDRGQIATMGPVDDVIAEYSRLRLEAGGDRFAVEHNAERRCVLTGVRVLNRDGAETPAFDISDEVIVSISYRVLARVRSLQIVLALHRNLVQVTHSYHTDGEMDPHCAEPGDYESVHRIPAMFLKGGRYSVGVSCRTPNHLFHHVDDAAAFDIEELSLNTHQKGYRRDRPGYVIAPGSWETRKIPA